MAPILLHPDDRPLWELTHTDYLWDVDLADGQTITVAGDGDPVLHTPGPRARRGLLLTSPTSAASSPATPCSRAGRARPAAPTATPT